MSNDLCRVLIIDDNPEDRELMRRLGDGLAEFAMEFGLDEKRSPR
jgi:hypothetical protein